MPKPRTPPLAPTTLYLGDNDRVTCGTLRCAGASAFFNGRALSGRRMRPIRFTRAQVAAAGVGTPHAGFTFTCEGCGVGLPT